MSCTPPCTRGSSMDRWANHSITPVYSSSRKYVCISAQSDSDIYRGTKDTPRARSPGSATTDPFCPVKNDICYVFFVNNTTGSTSRKRNRKIRRSQVFELRPQCSPAHCAPLLKVQENNVSSDPNTCSSLGRQIKLRRGLH